jgi:hypothetical protein
LTPPLKTIGSCWAWIHSFVASASTPTGYGSKPSRTLAFTKQQGKIKDGMTHPKVMIACMYLIAVYIFQYPRLEDKACMLQG